MFENHPPWRFSSKKHDRPTVIRLDRFVLSERCEVEYINIRTMLEEEIKEYESRSTDKPEGKLSSSSTLLSGINSRIDMAYRLLLFYSPDVLKPSTACKLIASEADRQSRTINIKTQVHPGSEVPDKILQEGPRIPNFSRHSSVKRNTSIQQLSSVRTCPSIGKIQELDSRFWNGATVYLARKK